MNSQPYKIVNGNMVFTITKKPYHVLFLIEEVQNNKITHWNHVFLYHSALHYLISILRRGEICSVRIDCSSPEQKNTFINYFLIDLGPNESTIHIVRKEYEMCFYLSPIQKKDFLTFLEQNVLLRSTAFIS